MKYRTFLLLGTNLGDRKKNLTVARNTIDLNVGLIVKASSIYQTRAWGKTDQPDFLNQALAVETGLGAARVLNEVMKVEKAMGRVRSEKWSERIIDVDILLFENEIIATPELTVPHPQLHNRKFALVPLAEIAGDVSHPLLGLTISELAEQCTDVLEVHRFTE